MSLPFLLTPLYKDVHKSTSDVFSQGFVGKSSFKFSTDTKAGDFAVKSATVRSVGKDKTGQPKEVVSGTFEPSFEWKEYNLKVDAKLSTASDFTGTVSHRPSFLLDSKVGLGFNVTANAEKKQNLVSVLPSIEYQHEKFALQLNSKVSQSGKPHLATLTLNVQPVSGVYVGTSATAKIADGATKLKSAEGRVAGTFSDVAVSVGGSYEKCAKGLKKGALTPRVNYGILYNLSDNLSVASQGNWDTTGSGGSGPNVSFGGLYKVDSTLSFSEKLELGFKSKDEEEKTKPTTVRLVLGSTTKVNSNVSATVGVDVNVRSLLGEGDADHTCGIEFKFKQ